MLSVLVTGGAGYIGSHTCKALALAGHIPITYDSLENGHRCAVRWGPLEVGNIHDRSRLHHVITTHRVDAVVHCAAYIQVAESVLSPEKYYTNNVTGTLCLLDAMRGSGPTSIVFSSSAAVYGIPQTVPVTEEHPLLPVNPYGHTKRMVEIIFEDYAQAHGLRWAALRYFNAAGADPDGQIGPSHNVVTSLVPRVLMAGLGAGPSLSIYGTNYETPDGTAIRDYIHVADLAAAHVAALDYLTREGMSGPFNLGTGRGYSVREVVHTASDVLGRSVPTVICPPRPGDVAVIVANSEKAKQLLGWVPAHSSLEQIVSTAAAWESRRSRD